MRTAFVGQPIERLEDFRFVRGRGQYVDDLARKDADRRDVKIFDDVNVIRCGPILREKLFAPFAPHHFAVLSRLVQRRIKHDNSPARPHTSPRFRERSRVVG